MRDLGRGRAHEARPDGDARPWLLALAGAQIGDAVLGWRTRQKGMVVLPVATATLLIFSVCRS